MSAVYAPGDYQKHSIDCFASFSFLFDRELKYFLRFKNQAWAAHADREDLLSFVAPIHHLIQVLI